MKADPRDVMSVEIPEWRIIDDSVWFAAQERFSKRGSPSLGKRKSAVEHRLFENVALQLREQRVVNFIETLVDRHGTYGATAVAMARAAVRHDPILATAERAHTMRDDRAAARLAVPEAGERVLP